MTAEEEAAGSCPQGGLELYQLNTDLHEEDFFDSADPDDPPPWPLNGTAWCSGSMPNRLINKTVALLLVGQPFRAKNFLTHNHKTCAEGTYEVQQMVAETHKQNIIRPIEAMGFNVDVFLSDTPCQREVSTIGVPRRTYEEYKSDFNTEKALKKMYGSNVKGVFRANASEDMYGKFGDMFDSVASVMRNKGGFYEYFIVLRYDVAVDRSFLTIKTKTFHELHGGLTFFQQAHDFMWSFPGELWTCFHHWWNGCMKVVGLHGAHTIGWETRRQHGCFQFGPTKLKEWTGGYGFHVALDAIARKFMGDNFLQPRPHEIYHRKGTSAWDARGREHRCVNDGFDPPSNALEDRYMPYCFHVA